MLKRLLIALRLKREFPKLAKAKALPVFMPTAPWLRSFQTPRSEAPQDQQPPPPKGQP